MYIEIPFFVYLFVSLKSLLMLYRIPCDPCYKLCVIKNSLDPVKKKNLIIGDQCSKLNTQFTPQAHVSIFCLYLCLSVSCFPPFFYIWLITN